MTTNDAVVDDDNDDGVLDPGVPIAPRRRCDFDFRYSPSFLRRADGAKNGDCEFTNIRVLVE